ncbi:hypothetical protein BH24ACI3_BH24ACI3_14830 [soil metagenome]
MKIVITESASDDISEGYLFYERQFHGLGGYFESSIFADIRSLVVYAGIHELHFGDYFRMIASHFPYAIYYKVEENLIEIWAIIDTRRDPAKIGKRFSRD